MVKAASRQTIAMAYCGVRAAMGRIVTTEELEERIKHALETPLP